MENSNEITIKELNTLLDKMKKRLAVSNHSAQTIVNYLRAVEYMCKHTGKNSVDTEIDEITDYSINYSIRNLEPGVQLKYMWQACNGIILIYLMMKSLPLKSLIQIRTIPADCSYSN